MKTHKKLKARILSLVLWAGMVTTMMATAVFATGASSAGEIKSFDKMGEPFVANVGEGAAPHIYGLEVEIATPEEDLNLPVEWTAMVARTTTAPAEYEVVDSGKVDEPAVDEIIPDEDKVVDKDTDNSVSDNQPALQSHVEEKVDEDVSLAPKLEQKKETVVTTVESEAIAVQWKNHKE